jgi:hypothetical protein
MYNNDDFVLNGENENDNIQVVEPVNIIDSEDYAVRELLKIVALCRKHNLQEKPEVLAGLLDDLSAKLKSGNFLDVLKTPVVYGSIAGVLSLIIIYKLAKRKKK